MIRWLLIVALISTAPCGALAQERILSFVSDVVVLKNGDLDVTETITVQAEGQSIRRGIFRDFPTSYRRRDDTYVVVGFEVQSVTRDGSPEPYATENISNGVRARLGSADRNVARGPHVYVIRYRTTRQIGYFETFDELYWNATGNGWNFNIDAVEARITLPQGAQISQSASYTGAQGATGTHARVVEQTANRIVWRTTQRLPPYSGLTVAAGWQKGVIDPPSSAQRASWFLRDNLPILAALLGFIGVAGYYVSTWSRVGRDPAAGTIIPLFGPPDGMSAAAVRYVDQLGFDNRAFTAGIVDLGVNGHLRLDETDSTTKVVALPGKQPVPPAEQELKSKLFAGGETVNLIQSNHATIGSAKTALDQMLSSAYNGKLFTNNFGWSLLGFALVLIVIGTILFAMGSTKSGEEVAAGIMGTLIPSVLIAFAAAAIQAGLASHSRFSFWLIGGVIAWLIFAAGGLLFIYGLAGINLNLMIPAVAAYVMMTIAVLGFYLFKAPSREGQVVRDQIAGFREYLGVAEEDRLNFENPPEKTPQLFEKFLPYAIALDVENEWGKKFAAVLAAAAAAAGTAYAYSWYHGNRDWSRDPAGFSNHLGVALASTIAASATAPGSSSGSSGSGSSGGGGGGGGGGGW